MDDPDPVVENAPGVEDSSVVEFVVGGIVVMLTGSVVVGTLGVEVLEDEDIGEAVVEVVVVVVLLLVGFLVGLGHGRFGGRGLKGGCGRGGRGRGTGTGIGKGKGSTATASFAEDNPCFFL